MNINKTICKMFDRDKKGHINIGDLFKPISYILAFLILSPLSINGINTIMTEGGPESTTEMISVLGLIVALSVIMSIIIVEVPWLPILKKLERIKDIEIVNCKK